MYENVDYKIISFSRGDGIFVSLKVIFNNPFNINENFLVLTKEDINSSIELNLFNWIQTQRYTINELSFFALNNNLSMSVKDKDLSEITSYGSVTAGVNRIFANTFGINFN